MSTTPTPLEAAAARSWAMSRYTSQHMVQDVTVEEFHAQPPNVQQWHRERVTPLVLAVLDATGALLRAEYAPDEHLPGPDPTERVEQLADAVRKELGQ